MESKSFKKGFLPTILVFILVNSFAIGSKSWLEKKGVDSTVIMMGNLLLFLVSFIAFMLYRKALIHPTTAGFLRNVYSGMLLKLFACAAGAFVYIIITDGAVNKPALFACLFLYLLYTVIEMRSVLGISKELKKNG